MHPHEIIKNLKTKKIVDKIVRGSLVYDDKLIT
jgi:hypothetical protein